MKITVYTDASLSDKHHVAACGWIICYKKDGKHRVRERVKVIEGISRVQEAEAKSVIMSLQHAFLRKGVTFINIFTDSLHFVKHVNPKQKKENKIDLSEFYETIEICHSFNVNVRVNYIQGHSDSYYNNQIDNKVRIALRKYLIINHKSDRP